MMKGEEEEMEEDGPELLIKISWLSFFWIRRHSSGGLETCLGILGHHNDEAHNFCTANNTIRS